MSSRKGIPALVLGAAAVLGLVAGCGGSTGGSPQPSQSAGAAPSSSDSGSGNGVPKVQHPVDASALIKNPCSALTTADLSALGLGGAQPKNNSISIGPGCAWGVGTKDVGVTWLTHDTHGLSDIYSLKSQEAYFNETTVSGYPAVEADAVDRRSDGGCQVNVGVSDQVVFFASTDGADNGNQACSLAKQAASAVITNLKAVQGGG